MYIIQQYSSVASSHQNKELFEITNSNGKHETDRVDSTPSNRFWLKSFPKRDRNAILLCDYFVGPSNFIIELKPNADSSKPVRDSVSSDEFVMVLSTSFTHRWKSYNTRVLYIQQSMSVK